MGCLPMLYSLMLSLKETMRLAHLQKCKNTEPKKKAKDTSFSLTLAFLAFQLVDRVLLSLSLLQTLWPPLASMSTTILNKAEVPPNYL